MSDTQGESLADFILSDPSMLQATQQLREAEPDAHAKLKMRKARYYQAHKREVLERNKKWREEHKEYVGLCERRRQSREEYKQRSRERRRERMATEPAYREHTQEYMREWWKRKVKRMKSDPAYAAKVRAERHARYMARRAKQGGRDD